LRITLKHNCQLRTCISVVLFIASSSQSNDSNSHYWWSITLGYDNNNEKTPSWLWNAVTKSQHYH
jgi:hypothetical protein